MLSVMEELFWQCRKEKINMNKKEKLKVITQEELNCMMHMHEMTRSLMF